MCTPKSRPAPPVIAPKVEVEEKKAPQLRVGDERSSAKATKKPKNLSRFRIDIGNGGSGLNIPN